MTCAKYTEIHLLQRESQSTLKEKICMVQYDSSSSNWKPTRARSAFPEVNIDSMTMREQPCEGMLWIFRYTFLFKNLYKMRSADIFTIKPHYFVVL